MLEWVVETTVIASVLALVAMIAGRIRSLAPAARHALWVVVLVKLLMPPLVSWPWPMPRLSPSLTRFDLEAGQNLAGCLAVGDQETPTERLTHGDRPHATPTRQGLSELNVEAGSKSTILDHETFDRAKVAEPVRVTSIATVTSDYAIWVGLLGGVWLAVSLGIVTSECIRVIRFRRRLRGAMPAPPELLDETDRIAFGLGVNSPRILVVEELATPLLWCFGRATLLLPAALVEALPSQHWPPILTHELAHLRRGDQWISRLELLAGLVWWWNPIYWLARSKLDTEAELACDAWVVWALPKDRLAYAEILFELSAILSRVHSPAPALGIAGTGRFFERRLTMILHGESPTRPSRLGLLVVIMLVLFAAPSWSGSGIRLASVAAATTDAGEFTPDLNLDDDDDDDDDEADDDDAKEAAEARAKSKADKKKSKVIVKGSSGLKGAKKPGLEIKLDLKGLDPDLEKLKAGADELAKALPKDPTSKKEMAEFQAKAEAFGKIVAKSLGDGSDFQKTFDDLGKELEKKFGKGSDFEMKMEALGELMEKKFGDGSDFQKKMEAFGEQMEKSLGKGSDFEKKIEAIDKDGQVKLGESAKTKGTGSVNKKVANTANRAADREKRVSRIGERMAELEQELNELKSELKALRGEDRSKPVD